MRVGENSVKAGAGVVFLRERKEKFARFHRPRIDGKIGYFFVKQLGAYLVGVGAHQKRCFANLHVIPTSSATNSISSLPSNSAAVIGEALLLRNSRALPNGWASASLLARALYATRLTRRRFRQAATRSFNPLPQISLVSIRWGIICSLREDSVISKSTLPRIVCPLNSPLRRWRGVGGEVGATATPP